MPTWGGLCLPLILHEHPVVKKARTEVVARRVRLASNTTRRNSLLSMRLAAPCSGDAVYPAMQWMVAACHRLTTHSLTCRWLRGPAYTVCGL